MSENKVQDVAGITVGLGNTALTGLAGAATTFSGSVVPYAIDGKAYTSTIQTGAAFPTTDIATGVTLAGLQKANTGTVLVLGNQAGAAVNVVAQGSVEALDVGGNFVAPPKFPSLPDNFCPLAYAIVKAGATFVAATFLPGTTVWNTTGITIAVQNVVALPDRPAVA